MKNWTIGRRIIAGFSAVILVVVALSAYVAICVKRIEAQTELILADCMPGVYQIGRLEASVLQAESALYKHILAQDPSAIAELDQEVSKVVTTVGGILAEYEKTITRQEDRELLLAVERMRPDYLRARVAVLDLSRAGKKDEALKVAKQDLNPKFQAYIGSVRKLVDFNKQSADLAGTQTASTVSNARVGLFAGSAIAIVAAIAISMLLIAATGRLLRRVAASIEDGANQVSSAAGQVSSSSQALAEGASEQAASLEETSSSLEEMASMTRRNSENAQQANQIAQEARRAAERGAADMESMSSSMEEIKHSSDEIAKIIKTIDEIAFQTNILALNAAVEAARAGDAGMGFAVVADEVRNLAQRSAHAAKETAAKIEGAISRTAQGLEINHKVAQALNDIVTRVRQVDELVAEVAQASREQTQGVGQINTAVSQLDKVTQTNAATAEESASAAEELSAQAQLMKQSVGDLQRLIGGSVRQEELTSEAPRTARDEKPHLHRKNSAIGTPRSQQPIVAKVVPAELASANRRNEIPLEGDFKDF